MTNSTKRDQDTTGSPPKGEEVQLLAFHPEGIITVRKLRTNEVWDIYGEFLDFGGFEDGLDSLLPRIKFSFPDKN